MLVPEIVAAGGGLLFAFDHATIAGKLVLTLLAVVSIFSWSIMITKLRVIRFARKQNARFLAAFRQDGMLVGFGATSKHCAFYLMSSTTVDEFQDDLKNYDTSTGTIRFLPDKPLPDKLVRKLVKARLAANVSRGEKKSS